MTTEFATVHNLPLSNNEVRRDLADASEVDLFRAGRHLGERLDNMLRAVDTKKTTFRKELKQDMIAAFSIITMTSVYQALVMKAYLRMTILSRSYAVDVNKETAKQTAKALRIGASILLEMHDESTGTADWFRRSGPARARSIAKIAELEARTETVMEMEDLLETKVCGELRAIRANTDHLGGIAKDMVALNSILAPQQSATAPS